MIGRCSVRSFLSALPPCPARSLRAPRKSLCARDSSPRHPPGGPRLWHDSDAHRAGSGAGDQPGVEGGAPTRAARGDPASGPRNREATRLGGLSRQPQQVRSQRRQSELAPNAPLASVRTWAEPESSGSPQLRTPLERQATVSLFHEGIWGWCGGGLGTRRQSQSSQLLRPAPSLGCTCLGGGGRGWRGIRWFEPTEGVGQVPVTCSGTRAA